MAIRDISEFRRRAFRTALNVGLGIGVFTVIDLSNATQGFAQLRTGRSTDREFYSLSEPSAAATPSSRVVQAGCKNCQAGIAHSHGPIAAPHRQLPSEVMEADEDYSESLGPSEDTHDSNAMVLGSYSQPCMTGCESVGLLIQPPKVVSSLLRRMQFRIEAATFWPDGQNLPQLVTTTRPANDPATDGLIGQAATTNLFGGSKVLGESTQGIRGELGSYFDDCRTHGLLLRFFDIGSNSLSYNSIPTSEPVVMRPFFSTANNAQATIAVNYPNSTSGSLNANISSDMYGGDILFRKLILRDCAGRIEFLAGYQTARLSDSLLINSTTTALVNTPAPVGTISQLTDNFTTSNRFNGMALGLNGILRERCWSLSGMVKLGFGNMERSVGIHGSSTITVPGNPNSTTNSANGLLARNTNEGNYVMNTFIVSPETNITIGYRLTRRLEATVGYSYLGLPKVARVADQLDPQLASNLSNPPTGASTPRFALLESNYSLQSLNYGLQWRY